MAMFLSVLLAPEANAWPYIPCVYCGPIYPVYPYYPGYYGGYYGGPYGGGYYGGDPNGCNQPWNDCPPPVGRVCGPCPQ